jgi:hypothetical protein
MLTPTQVSDRREFLQNHPNEPERFLTLKQKLIAGVSMHQLQSFRHAPPAR